MRIPDYFDWDRIGEDKYFREFLLMYLRSIAEQLKDLNDNIKTLQKDGNDK